MDAGTLRNRASAVLAGLLCLVAVTAPALGDSPGLAILMERMQTYTHKLQLSVEARNERLAHFYIHELEETSAYVAESIPHYDDYPVGPLVREMLLPRIEDLEDAVEAGEWTAVDTRFADMLRACNACHVATHHDYVRIAPATGNPFAQDFSVPED
ncbi:MAG: hypothetical protein ACNA8G_09970 [Gammaproteobacteria bacterium]